MGSEPMRTAEAFNPLHVGFSFLAFYFKITVDSQKSCPTVWGILVCPSPRLPHIYPFCRIRRAHTPLISPEPLEKALQACEASPSECHHACVIRRGHFSSHAQHGSDSGSPC